VCDESIRRLLTTVGEKSRNINQSRRETAKNASFVFVGDAMREEISAGSRIFIKSTVALSHSSRAVTAKISLFLLNSAVWLRSAGPSPRTHGV
jgi:hypothetical protein